MDAIEKLQRFYNQCNRFPEVITRESIIQNMFDRGDKLSIEESLDGGTLTDDALVVLRKLNFTYDEIATLFDEKPSTLRQRSRRLKDLYQTA
jgi:DNA-directed RNA polymerase specialized sigma24 family protein